MRIQLNQDEIHEALVGYIAEQGVDVGGKSIDIHMTAGRGENGYTADVNITQSIEASAPVGVLTRETEQVIHEDPTATTEGLTEDDSHEENEEATSEGGSIFNKRSNA